MEPNSKSEKKNDKLKKSKSDKKNDTVKDIKCELDTKSHKSESESKKVNLNAPAESDAKRVRVYINELKDRLSHLQNQQAEIEKAADTLLKDGEIRKTDSTSGGEADDEASATDSGYPNDNAGPSRNYPVREAQTFTVILNKFKGIESADKSNIAMTELKNNPDELTKLRQQNGSIRFKIKQLQDRIDKTKLTPSDESMVEKQVRTQLYDTLNKVNDLENEISCMESYLLRKNTGITKTPKNSKDNLITCKDNNK